MDEIDMAQAAEQRDRDLALAELHRRIAASFAPRADGVDERCMDCDELIEPERLKALRGCCSRCIHCATKHELRGYRA